MRSTVPPRHGGTSPVSTTCPCFANDGECLGPGPTAMRVCPPSCVVQSAAAGGSLNIHGRAGVAGGAKPGEQIRRLGIQCAEPCQAPQVVQVSRSLPLVPGGGLGRGKRRQDRHREGRGWRVAVALVKRAALSRPGRLTGTAEQLDPHDQPIVGA